MIRAKRWQRAAWCWALAALGGCTDQVKLGSTGKAGSAALTPTGGTSELGRGGTSALGGSPNGTGGGVTVDVAPCSGVAYVPGLDASGTACNAVRHAVEAPKLDVYIMMDRTQSMGYSAGGGTRWDAVKLAVEQFLSEAQDIQVGIQFFGLTGNQALDCDPTGYATPAVEIASLPEVGQAVLAAMGATLVGGSTPTAPALAGAIEHARAWALTHPERRAVVMLVTDGLPSPCDPSMDPTAAVAAIAADGVDGYPPIFTLVLGVAMGLNHFGLDQIARAGGTGQAYLTQDDDIAGSLVTALSRMVKNPLPCEYTLPRTLDTGLVVDTSLVQMVHTSAGVIEEIPRVGSRGACHSAYGGWYYDRLEEPARILVCPCTCANFGSGTVDVYVGCSPTLG
jgi:hypothetical protein